MEICHESGALRRFVTIETPIIDAHGNVTAVEGTARDITEKRKAEEQLEKYRLRLEDLVQQRTGELQAFQKQLVDIIDFFPDPLYVVDADHKIIAWNRAMAVMTKISKHEVIGSSYLVSIQKWPICPISSLHSKFFPRNINHMSAEKFIVGLDLDQISLFLDGHYLDVVSELYGGSGPTPIQMVLKSATKGEANRDSNIQQQLQQASI